MIVDLIKTLAPAVAAFWIGIAATPLVTHYLYRYRMWKKRAGNTKGLGDDSGTPLFNELHKERETRTPRMGGLVVVVSVLATVGLFWTISYLLTGGPSGKIDFLSRTQTWLPLVGFIVGAVVGLIEDLAVASIFKGLPDGLSFHYRALPVLVFGLFAAWWFYEKLGMHAIDIPFYGILEIGIWFIPFFLLVLLSILASGIIDGLDGLSGGVLATVFSAYGLIAFFQHQIDLSALSFVIVGALLAFLWFNIPPARFYLTEVGFMPLALALTIIVFLTGQVIVFPLIAFVQTATVVTNVLQIASKRFFGRKIFRIAPIHHHFEAIGWPAYKVVMRYWVVSIVFAAFGALIALIG